MKMPRRKPSGTGRYPDDTTIPDTDHDSMSGSYPGMRAEDEVTYPGDDSDEMYDEIGDDDLLGEEDDAGTMPPRRSR